MYSMVNVEQSQIAVTAETVEETERLYRAALLRQNIIHEEQVYGTYEAGVIAEIRTAVMDGNTHFFIRLERSQVFYVITAAQSPAVVLLDVGDRVEIYHTGIEDGLATAYRIIQP